jgi:NAD(P)-dependent dehydrogenase (short-subunit alcohol dehydrogenase family)
MARAVVAFGATGGLGRAVVPRLKADGYEVAAFGSEVDATVRDAVAAAVAPWHERLYAVVHMVGGWRGGAPLHETPAEWLELLWRQNVLTAWNVLQVTLPTLVAKGEGRVVLVGAYGALRRARGQAAYNAAKAALQALAETVAEEVRTTGVTVSVLLPTVIDTPANRAQRGASEARQWVAPTTLADLVAFLLGPAGADLNGASIPVRGRL